MCAVSSRKIADVRKLLERVWRKKCSSARRTFFVLMLARRSGVAMARTAFGVWREVSLIYNPSLFRCIQGNIALLNLVM